MKDTAKSEKDVEKNIGYEEVSKRYEIANERYDLESESDVINAILRDLFGY
jgi:hypothetical protein